MSEHWTDRLSGYLDGELSEAEVARLEAHVGACRACATTLDELRSIVAAAATLPDEAPSRDLWPEIEARLSPRISDGVMASVVPIGGADAGRRRVSFTVPQLIAAGIALMLIPAAAVWLALAVGGPAGTPAAPPVASAESSSAITFVAAWDAAVADLEAEFVRRRQELDPSTILVVERNLAIIDEAVAEARRALEADPSSEFLNGYVADAMRRKVDLLRQATRIQRAET